MSATRTETDTFGPIEVPADRLWGAQTQRSLEHFRISGERMPRALIRALALVKKAAALVNAELGLLDGARPTRSSPPPTRCSPARYDAEFPLVVWQTGSGTQTNMNVNEVLANRASELLGGPRGEGRIVHPNDDVNQGQSSNDVFPTAMHVAAVAGAARARSCRPCAALRDDARGEGRGVRRHREDRPHPPAGRDAAHAGPGVLRLRARSSTTALAHLEHGAAPPLRAGARRHRRRHRPQRAPRVRGARGGHELAAADRPAVRDGAQQVRGARRARRAGLRPRRAEDARGRAASRSPTTCAGSPRARARASARSRIPENEPGSSIMPGKVNPTQCEALTMAARAGDGQRRRRQPRRRCRATSSSTSSSR